MLTFLPLLAHVGVTDNAWLGVATISAIVLTLIFLGFALGMLRIEAPGDLLLPLAVVVLIAGLAGTLGDAINDQGPWAVPLGLVSFGALLLAAFRSDGESAEAVPDDAQAPTRRVKTRLLAVTGGISLLAVVALMPVIEYWWFGDGTDESFSLASVTWYWEDGYGTDGEVFLPERGDATVALSLVTPPDETGTFTVKLTITGGSLGPFLAVNEADDPEEQMVARWLVGPVYLNPPISEACAAVRDCTETEVTMTLPAGFVDDAPEVITVELLTQNGLPFAEPLTASVRLTEAG